ncbi:MAG: cell division protein FtsZ [Proteobacteria bacterium]|nr:cell division protein FtsZ [Pseudomonadota bacterium]
MAISLSAPRTTELKPRIVVFGVGGAGGNAVNNMIETGLEGCEFVCANTDAQQLQFAKTDKRIQLGVAITQGLGAGAHPEVGMSAAEESTPEVVEHLEGAHMVFITAGMGGGTGTGAAPIIARCARERGILTVGVVTKPFQFEGRHRMRMAEAGIAELQRHVDTLIIIPNQNLFRIANEKTTFADAFTMADQVLHSGVRSITDLMVLPGLINLDFADVRTVMSEMGKAMMGTGEASGEDRALMAAQNAIQNPLLDEVSLKGAKAVLVNVTGGYDMTLLEVDEAANAISAEVDADANIIFGAAFDPELEGKIRVAVVATGMEGSAAQAVDPRRGAAPIHPQGRAPMPQPVPPPVRQPEPIRPAAYHAPEPQYAPPPEPQPVAAMEPAPAAQPQSATMWKEPKRVAFEEYAATPTGDAPAQAQADLYGEPAAAPVQPAFAPAPRPAPAPERQPEPLSAEVEEETPLFPDRNYAGDRRRGGFLGLFGGRARAAGPEETPSGAPNYRQASVPVTRGGAAPKLAEEQEPLDASDDLEIPSFLRRLAN